jgi:aquaglyceroporin related protein
MVPTRSEINLQNFQSPAAGQPVQDPANVDLEQGRIEPTLKLGKISSQIQNIREQRENNLLRTFSRADGPRAEGPPVSNLGRIPSGIAGPLSPTSEAIQEEEDDLGLQPLESVQEEQPGRMKPEEEMNHSPHWYPDDAASAITEHEQEGDLDGDLMREDILLPAYDVEEDEIHNLHTHWSVIRLRFREPLAELLAVRSSTILFQKRH